MLEFLYRSQRLYPQKYRVFFEGEGKAHPKEVINHHAPQTFGKRQGARNRLAYSKGPQEGTVMFFNRVLSGEGAIAIANLESI